MGNIGEKCGCVESHNERDKALELRDGRPSGHAIGMYAHAETVHGCGGELGEVDKGLWKEVDEIFEKYNTNRDGRLSAKEARPYIRKWATGDLGYEPGDEMLTNFFLEIDQNQDNFVDASTAAAAPAARSLQAGPLPPACRSSAAAGSR